MNVNNRLASMLASSRSHAYKLGWGMRSVGITATLRGAVRSALLHLQRPQHAQIKLASGPVIEFAYPSQVPTALVMFGDLIDPEFAFLRRIARPDWIVADIGAAIGQFTLFAGCLPVACVHAFEPSGANIRTLQRNIERNCLADRVHIHQLALGEAEYEAVFETTDHTWVSRLAQSSGHSGAVEQTETVQVRTLAGELEHLGVDHLSLLKINVAGFETAVLAGAEPLLRRGGADILVLLLGLASLPEYAKLAGWGYRFFYFHPREAALYEVTQFDAAAVLDHRPWPARHIIAIHNAALARGLIGDLAVRKPHAAPAAPEPRELELS
ncbi:FkbM family methyltransferase [Devosia sp. 1635]|uniref:FkbM family methyltransferase n=1 Tax=Devosia sp. 1635 TaxID=2726066 RepID=UPI001564C325